MNPLRPLKIRPPSPATAAQTIHLPTKLVGHPQASEATQTQLALNLPPPLETTWYRSPADHQASIKAALWERVKRVVERTPHYT